MGADLPEMRGTMYVMTVVGQGDQAPKLKVDAHGNVEFVNFKPDVASKELFEIIGKNAAHEWRLRAGYDSPESVYIIQPKPG